MIPMSKTFMRMQHKTTCASVPTIMTIIGAIGGLVYYLKRKGIISFKYDMIPTSLKDIKFEIK